MKLREILPPDAEIEPRHADLDIGGVTADSRTVKKGDLFAAIAGGKTDGTPSSPCGQARWHYDDQTEPEGYADG